MRTVADLPSSPASWRGVAAFALDNLVPLFGFTAIVIGAFHLPGVWGSVAGWVATGAALLYVHHLLQDDIAALKAQAQADRVDRRRALARSGPPVKAVA
jgi:hypothetical protein